MRFLNTQEFPRVLHIRVVVSAKLQGVPELGYLQVPEYQLLLGFPGVIFVGLDGLEGLLELSLYLLVGLLKALDLLLEGFDFTLQLVFILAVGANVSMNNLSILNYLGFHFLIVLQAPLKLTL